MVSIYFVPLVNILIPKEGFVSRVLVNNSLFSVQILANIFTFKGSRWCIEMVHIYYISIHTITPAYPHLKLGESTR